MKDVSMKYIMDFLFKECSSVANEMKNSDHHFDYQNLNPYHLEGDVLTHTMMVLQQAEERNMSTFIKWACLFHDFAKPDARFANPETKRVSFYAHESYSAYKSLAFMKKLNFSNDEIERMFKLISLHTEMYKMVGSKNGEKKILTKYAGQKQLVEDLRDLAICDGMGRFSDPEVSDKIAGTKELIKVTDSVLKQLKPQDVVFKSKEAIVFIGLPASGKSTYRDQILSTRDNFEVASSDDLVLALADKGLTYNEAFKSVDRKDVEKKLNERIKELVKDGKNIIFDLTNMSKKGRRKKLASLTREYKKTAYVFLTDFETLEIRNKIRGQQGKYIPPSVIEGMVKAFHPPMYDDFDEIRYIVS